MTEQSKAKVGRIFRRGFRRDRARGFRASARVQRVAMGTAIGADLSARLHWMAQALQGFESNPQAGIGERISRNRGVCSIAQRVEPGNVVSCDIAVRLPLQMASRAAHAALVALEAFSMEAGQLAIGAGRKLGAVMLER
jgi:hypothetical protein